MAQEVHTEDKLVYQFFPVTSGSLFFKVKCANDAHIALSPAPTEGTPLIEIMIGGWGNSKTAIRKNRTKPDKALVETPDILSAGELRGFWVRWANGSIAVGKEGDAQPFASWDDPEPFGIGYYGICTGWGATGEWIVEVSQAAQGPGWAVDPSQVGGAACWVDAANGQVPPGAVPAGMDNEQLYVGRARHEGALLPGKIVPSHGVCYVPWGGGEHGKAEYQVLCGCQPVWMPAQGAQVPSDALPAGETEGGEPLFVGRAVHNGVAAVGKVQASHNCCYVPYGGQEIPCSDYEVLVAK